LQIIATPKRNAQCKEIDQTATVIFHQVSYAEQLMQRRRSITSGDKELTVDASAFERRDALVVISSFPHSTAAHAILRVVPVSVR